MLFYHVVKAHAFPDGNKRVALLLLFGFLAENDRALKIPTSSLVRTATAVAASSPGNRSVCLGQLANWIGRYVVPLNQLKKTVDDPEGQAR